MPALSATPTASRRAPEARQLRPQPAQRAVVIVAAGVGRAMQMVGELLPEEQHGAWQARKRCTTQLPHCQ